jgi:hypothetical protein
LQRRRQRIRKKPNSPFNSRRQKKKQKSKRPCWLTTAGKEEAEKQAALAEQQKAKEEAEKQTALLSEQQRAKEEAEKQAALLAEHQRQKKKQKSKQHWTNNEDALSAVTTFRQKLSESSSYQTALG